MSGGDTAATVAGTQPVVTRGVPGLGRSGYVLGALGTTGGTTGGITRSTVCGIAHGTTGGTTDGITSGAGGPE